MPQVPSTTITAAFTLPAIYVNHVHFAATGETYRLTFFENTTTGEVTVEQPRAAIALSREAIMRLYMTLGYFLSQTEGVVAEAPPQGRPQ